MTGREVTEDGRETIQIGGKKGDFSVVEDDVRRALSAFPKCRVLKGWVPEVFAALPEQQYRFVHIDVDLYQPTLDCLEYFHPRMAPGGIIINDDYFSTSFPGGGRAWKEYCDSNQIPFLPLDTGQAVLFT